MDVDQVLIGPDRILVSFGILPGGLLPKGLDQPAIDQAVLGGDLGRGVLGLPAGDPAGLQDND